MEFYNGVNSKNWNVHSFARPSVSFRRSVHPKTLKLGPQFSMEFYNGKSSKTRKIGTDRQTDRGTDIHKGDRQTDRQTEVPIFIKETLTFCPFIYISSDFIETKIITLYSIQSYCFL